jgi:PAS domain-containing protein
MRQKISGCALPFDQDFPGPSGQQTGRRVLSCHHRSLHKRFAIVFVMKGFIRYWNSGAEQMFGHTVADAIGQSLDFICPI